MKLYQIKKVIYLEELTSSENNVNKAENTYEILGGEN